MARWIRKNKAFEDVVVVERLGDNIYKVKAVERTHPYRVSANRALPYLYPGMRVRVAINGSLREIVGIASPVAAGKNLPPWIDHPTSVPVDSTPIEVAAGLWSQAGGLWTSRYSSLVSSTALPLSNSMTSIVTGESAAATAFSMRGISIIPRPDGKIVGSLHSTYQSRGPESVLRTSSETLYAPADPTYFVSTVYDIEEVTDFYSEELATLGSPYVSHSIGNSLYAIVNSSVDETISYDYWTSTNPDSYSRPTTAGETDITMPHLVHSIISVTVDGVSDPTATFYNSGSVGHVVLTNPAPGGVSLVIDYTTGSVLPQSDYFPAAISGRSAFALSHSPVVGTISATSGSLVGFTGTVLLNGSTVRFAYVFHDVDASIDVEYTYYAEFGELWDMATLTIEERGIAGSSHSASLVLPMPSDFNATPDSPFGVYPLDEGLAWKSGWQHTHWGYSHYSPREDCYSVAGPHGLYYRSRTPGSVENTHWTRMAWPIEFPSQDKTITDQVEIIPRRTAPFFGVSLADRYAFQGSWGNVIYGGPANSVDTSFPIRVFRKNTSNVWGLQRAFEPSELVGTSSSALPLYVASAGIFHLEGSLGWANGRSGCTLKNTWWPATRNAEAFICGASWARNEWGETRPNNVREDWTSCPYGIKDAALTLCAVGNNGDILGKLTLRGDESYTENEVSNLATRVNYLISEAAAFTNDFGIFTTYAAVAGWGCTDGHPSYGYVYNYYLMSSVDSLKTPDLRHAGMPTLADRRPIYGDYGTIENYNDGTQSLFLDDSNKIYLTVAFPYWVRTLNQAEPTPTEQVYGTWNSGPFTSYGPWYEFEMTGYNGQPILSEVIDQYASGGSTYPKLDGSYQQVFPQAGTTTSLATTYQKQVIFIPPIIIGYTEGGSPIYQLQSFSNLEIPWRHEIPHRTYSTLNTYYPIGTPGTSFYALPGYDEFPPYTGAVVYDNEGDHRKSFLKEARNFLMRVSYISGTLVEDYRIDISQQKPISPDPYIFGEGTPLEVSENRVAVSRWAKVHFTRRCGRYIFILRDWIIDSLVAATGATVYEEALVLEVWNDTGSPTFKERIFLPAVTEPVDYVTYQGSGKELDMLQGVTSSSTEWVYIVGKRVRSDARFRAKVIYNAGGVSTMTYATDFDPFSERTTQGAAISGNNSVVSYFDNTTSYQ